MDKSQGVWPAVGAAALVGLGAWFFFGGGLDAQVEKDTQGIYAKVASDAVDQYQITERNGSAIDRCTSAAMVVAAFLQAKDEPNYIKWKDVRRKQCAAAGMPI